MTQITPIGIGNLKTLTKKSASSQAASQAGQAAQKQRPFHARSHEIPQIHQSKNANGASSAQSPSSALSASNTEEGQLSVDILHKEDQMVVVCPIAGVEKSEIRVALQDDVLTIRGERKTVEGLELHTPIVKELFWGTFSRSIILPDHIDRKGIQARVHEHLLIITIPKTEDYRTRVIHVNE